MSFRSWLWQLLSALYVRTTSGPFPLPGAQEGDRVEIVPIGQRWPGLAAAPLFAARETPRSERPSAFELRLMRLFLWLKDLVPLGPDDGPAWRGGLHYPERYEPVAASPPRPAAWDSEDPIAAIAQRGTFSLLTERTADGYALDARGLDVATYRSGFLPCGGRALLVRDGDRLRTTSVEVAGERAEPGDAAFPLLQRRLLVGLNTYVTTVEHLGFCHLAVANTFAIATYATLPAHHPLMTALHPFVIEVIRLVNHHADGLIASEHSNIPRYTGLPLREVERLLCEASASFDLNWLHPVHRAEQLGTAGDAAFPTVASACRAWAVFAELGRRWSEEILVDVDDPTRAWCEQLDELLPGGVRRPLGIEPGAAFDLVAVGDLLARLAYVSSAFHTQVGDDVRAHMLHVDVMPPCVRTDGSAPLAHVEEKTNSILVAGIRRYMLAGQSLPNADARGAAIWSSFQSALQGFEAERGEGITPAAGRASAHA